MGLSQAFLSQAESGEGVGVRYKSSSLGVRGGRSTLQEGGGCWMKCLSSCGRSGANRHTCETEEKSGLGAQVWALKADR